MVVKIETGLVSILVFFAYNKPTCLTISCETSSLAANCKQQKWHKNVSASNNIFLWHQLKYIYENEACFPRNSKGDHASFRPCVKAMGRQPYWRSHMDASYFSSGFDTICTRYCCCVFYHAITLMPAWFWVHARKATLALWNCLVGLSYEKIRRYNNSPPYVMARWLPQQILL